MLAPTLAQPDVNAHDFVSNIEVARRLHNLEPARSEYGIVTKTL